MAAYEPVGPVLGGDDLWAGGEVEVGLVGVAEPDAVAGADLAVGGQVNGDGLEDAAACRASVVAGVSMWCWARSSGLLVLVVNQAGRTARTSPVVRWLTAARRVR